MKRFWYQFVILLTLATCANGHVVSQIYGEWRKNDPLEIEILFDAGYAVPEWRDDLSSPAPTRSWLVGLNDHEWSRLRAEAERYVRECLILKSAGKSVPWQVTFPDFQSSPPAFPQLLNDGAYFRMLLISDSDFRVDEIFWKEGNRPSLVMKSMQPDESFIELVPGEHSKFRAEQSTHKQRDSWAVAFYQGFLHVLPKGLDHVLFVIGLFFYRREWRPLLWQSLAFTLAHTVTLGLATAGIVKISGTWVEPMIALSLVAVAVENICGKQKSNSVARLGLVFGFGLIHGLGFAGALSVWLSPGDGFITTLFSANLGVEIAQALIIAAAWVVTMAWSKSCAYRYFRSVCCAGIACTGLFWTCQRIGMFG